ncbi:hypothetical protein BHE74_00017804 [Ensete ventricosum]|nr:hypothetical protein GW17_00004372 [Ensete ventricosum]RWW74268.1 hypothetical protein BHE74_00017804 [Ensete ventricosum]RZR97198.1 hypothetical protein BHM03_00026336 [Ensete ventricosum]
MDRAGIPFLPLARTASVLPSTRRLHRVRQKTHVLLPHAGGRRFAVVRLTGQGKLHLHAVVVSPAIHVSIIIIILL